MLLKDVSSIVFLSLILMSCDTKNTGLSNWKKPETNIINCEPYSLETTSSGFLYNNVWNKQAAHSFSWQQCLEKNKSNGLVGWSWTWPENSNVIFSYPQIKRGISPWDPHSEIQSEYPLNIRDLKSLVVEHELEVQGNSEHNIATSFWLTNTKEIGEKQNQKAIIAELMVWSYSTKNHMNPAGSKIGDIEIDGKVWEVWTERNWSDASGANSNRWIYITFRAKSKSYSSSFDLVKFTEYAIKNNLLPTEFYVSDVELGTEIMSGSGLVWVNKFEVTINK